ncbi:Serine hydrolase [Leishmania braziliensis]|nr:Serine hydrolase [Leishmania braziliensis]
MPVRVLCLHGSRQTREIFQNQLSLFQDDLAHIAELVFLEAPHVLPFITAQDDILTRSWCSTDGKEDYSAGDALVASAMQPGGPDTDLAFTIMFGFSQGALMIYRYLWLHARDTAVSSQLRGVIVAGAQDPRRMLPCGGGRTLSQLPPDRAAGSFAGPPVFGALPFLHLIGRKDTIVAPEESAAFAQVCSSTSRVLFHEHAHSIPALKEVRTAVREVCLAASMSSVKVAEALEARAEELEMVRSMYEEECVLTRGDETLVRIPLFTDAESLLASSSSSVTVSLDASTVHALERIKVCFHVPWSYPSTLPMVEITGGPTWHSVKYERWAAGMVVRTSAYLADELGVGTAMLLPAYLYTAGLAQEEVDILLDVFTKEACSGDRAHGCRDGGADGEAAVSQLAGPWATEDVLLRQTYITEAEAKAVEVLLAEAKRNRDCRRPATDGGDDGRDAESEVVELEAPTAAGGGGGTCTLTIGLIGKPSAGKSTFFNAVTNPADESDAARVASFPFTTIEPNIGTALAPLYCPCATLRAAELAPADDDATGVTAAACSAASCNAALSSGLTGTLCDAAYGHVCALGSDRFRRHPVKVKDVAGLVQGAYQGKGKGNQFLNDLCDADVLVHVVDGAAATEADGTACTPGQGSTMEDIAWVRSEVHSWIYDNLRAKWTSLVRQPTKLRTMFSGYRSTPAFVDRVLRRVGIANDIALTAILRTWGPQELHAFVALYIRLRFPLIVALNKADLPAAAGVAEALRQAYPHEVFVPMTARIEWLALQLSRKGYIDYTSGVASLSGTFGHGDAANLDKSVRQELYDVTSFFRTTTPSQEVLSSPLLRTTTGVQDVLAAAMEACGVMLVYPVRTFHPVTSLAHCLTFKLGSSAGRVFDALVHLKLLEGKLVRFEVIDLAPVKRLLLQQLMASLPSIPSNEASTPVPAQPKQRTVELPTLVKTLRKTEVISSSVVLARILSNKFQPA